MSRARPSPSTLKMCPRWGEGALLGSRAPRAAPDPERKCVEAARSPAAGSGCVRFASAKQSQRAGGKPPRARLPLFHLLPCVLLFKSVPQSARLAGFLLALR